MENETMILCWCQTTGRFLIKLKSEVPEHLWPENIPPTKGASSVGDRFYMQQNAKKRPAAAPSKEKKLTKKDMAAKLNIWLPSVDLEVLLGTELEALISFFEADVTPPLVSHFMPTEKRLKAPWVELLKQLIPVEVNWTKCTIAQLQAVYKDYTNDLN